jgi:hypothetical protein
MTKPYSLDLRERVTERVAAEQRRDDGDDEEDNRPVQEISEIHDLNSVVST